MLKMIEKTEVSIWGLVSTPFLLTIGFVGVIKGWPLSWSWLFVFSSLALIFQFGWNAYKVFFKPFGKGKIKVILLFAVLSFAMGMLALLVGDIVFHSKGNDNFSYYEIANNSFFQNIYFLLTTWISLAGEELITAAVAFPLYHYLVKTNKSNQAFLISAIVSSLFFGMLHLSTYSWNWYQSLIVIGLVRLPITYAWKKTNSLLGGIIVHVIYDYALFIPAIVQSVL